MNKEFDRSLPSEIAIISDLLFECFEVAVHQILYIRNVYPKALFQKHQKFASPVYMARHPELKNYISNFLKSIKGDIEKRKITHLHVLICDQGGRKGGRGGRIVEEAVLEKFSFEIRPMMMHLHPKGGVGGGGSSSLSASVASKMRQELQLDLIQDSMRSLFQKILFCDSKLVPKNFLDPTFRLLVQMQDKDRPETIDEGDSWVMSEGASVTDPVMVPLQTVDTGLLKLFLSVQERRSFSPAGVQASAQPSAQPPLSSSFPLSTQ